MLVPIIAHMEWAFLTNGTKGVYYASLMPLTYCAALADMSLAEVAKGKLSVGSPTEESLNRGEGTGIDGSR